jgi:hypothetical protein
MSFEQCLGEWEDETEKFFIVAYILGLAFAIWCFFNNYVFREKNIMQEN